MEENGSHGIVTIDLSSLRMVPAAGVRYDEARALLGERGRHTFRAKLALEKVTQAEDAGQLFVTVVVRSKRALELSPSQREHLPNLFKAAERGARGALTVRVTSHGELWGHVAAY